MVVGSGSRTRILGEAFRNCAPGDNSGFRSVYRKGYREPAASANPILDDPDELHVAWLLKLRPWPGVQIIVGAVAALILLDGLIPSIRYIYSKTTSPFSIRHYAQHEVAVSRFLRHVVAGQEHPGPPQLEHNEFNRIEGIPDAPYDTFVCQDDAYSIIHLFLRDYDDDKILSFCGGFPFFFVMTRAGRMER